MQGVKKLLVAALLMVAVAGCQKGPPEELWMANARTWPSMPLTVEWTGIHRDFNSSMTGAIDLWNHNLGFKAFTEATGPLTADVHVREYEGAGCGTEAGGLEEDPKALAATWICPDGTALVQFKSMSDLVSVYLAMTHELGHVLGLGHVKRGLMAPSFADSDPSALGSEGLQLPPMIAPSNDAIKALNARYKK